MTTKQAAEFLGVSIRQINFLIERGDIKAARDAHNYWEVDAASVRARKSALKKKETAAAK